MVNQHAPLFLPEEHHIISNQLDVEPAETLPSDLILEQVDARFRYSPIWKAADDKQGI